MHWRTSRREIGLDRPLVMAILNLTPDSFSDGGRYPDPDTALARVDEMIAEGADIIDIGGESTRPGAERVPAGEEIQRTVPVISAIVERFGIPVSIDTSKSEVAAAALDAGAEIVNDVSGLRFDPELAAVAAERGAGLVLMHLRGEFATMHSLEPVADIIGEVTDGFRESLGKAFAAGVEADSIVLDIGLGFGKSYGQNLGLVGRLSALTAEFAGYPFLVGASRKSFIGRALGDVPPSDRLPGSLAAAAIAVWNGARIVRVHDVRETAAALKFVNAVIENL